MKLSKKYLVMVSLMLFSLFFGAGNLIFPPFLGQNAGSNTFFALLGFLFTAVLLPVCGVLAVARFGGLEKLSSRVGVVFATVFTFVIYLSIGPGLGIPRAASVPFEMAIQPYLSTYASTPLFMLLYSALFFLAASWLAMNPNKLVERFGKILTPTLLSLIALLFIGYLVGGNTEIGVPQEAYATEPVVVGFLEGYNTMDAIAALNFGFVISTAINQLGVKENKNVMKEILHAGIFAGLLLTAVYVVLALLGMRTSGLYTIEGNGAWVLRCIVKDVFGEPGAILLASIFTLACLTTCVGLITSISEYFAGRFKFLSYKKYVLLIAFFSFVVCNQGLNTILSISVPVLNIIYPIAIVLIVFGLCDPWVSKMRYAYCASVFVTGAVSVVYTLETFHITFGPLNALLAKLPLYSSGLGWVSALLITVLGCAVVEVVLRTKEGTEVSSESENV